MDASRFAFFVVTAVTLIAAKRIRDVRSALARNLPISPPSARPIFVDHRRGHKVFRARGVFERKDYKNNHWWTMIEGRLYHNVRTIDGRDFRRNFRIPATFFDDILRWIRHNGWAGKESDAFLRPAVPIELKVLAVFQMLGRGVLPSVPAGIIGCNEKTIGNFFKFFCHIVARNLYSQFICFPTSAEEVAACVQTYAKENLPGCMGSVDCVHIPWIKCLASVRSWFVGKEGSPTVAFQVCLPCSCPFALLLLIFHQVIVDHTTRILSITQPHPGAHNDKTIAAMDPWMHRIRTLALFTLFSWNALTPNGAAQFAGVYLICDGGYQAWRILQRCNVVTSCAKYLRLFGRIASARKDVECTFGRVKNRFRYLKIPNLLENLEDVANVFITCCIFHNMYCAMCSQYCISFIDLMYFAGCSNMTLKQDARSMTRYVLSASMRF
jgi:hypothetical protein